MLKVLRVFVLAALALTLGGGVHAQGKKAAAKKAAPEKGAADPAEKAAMDAMMKAAAPGAPHKALKGMAGSYTAAVTMWMAPGKPPAKATGKAEKKMIMGDRFLAEEFSGTMMEKPFTGMAVSGYDNLKKKYVYTWIDDMSTAVVYMEGTADRANKVITVEAEVMDPMTAKAKKVRAVTRIVSPKKHVFEWYDVAEGKPRKSMEIVYTRQ